MQNNNIEGTRQIYFVTSGKRGPETLVSQNKEGRLFNKNIGLC